jgi:hypothetical protein
MPINLYDHQKRAIEILKSGSILQGGVGSGKTLTALTYFVTKECGGKIQINRESGWSPMTHPKDLYVITTAFKRDTKDWEHESIPFMIPKIIVDSWNNLHKYIYVKGAFFIFDEQRLVGSGTWVKNFLKIAQNNRWILLTATPGDTWMDYIPVFIANGFYKNRTEFIRRHVIFNRFSKFPIVDHYVEVQRLIRLRDSIIVPMRFNRKTVSHNIDVICSFDKEKFNRVKINRWNIFTNGPIRDIAELCYTLRKVVNSDPSRVDELLQIFKRHNKVIVFYNFNYELDILTDFCTEHNIPFSQWNGHKHEQLLKTDKYLYLVQYTAGAEGWNCTDTNCVVFFSQNYSYKISIQAAGRIDRINTSFNDLYYYSFISNSVIDLAIKKALRSKKNFNEHYYAAI